MQPYLDTAPCGFVVFRDDGSVLTVNKTLCDWVKQVPDELMGKSVESILTIATRIFYNTHFFPLLKLHSKAEEIFLSLRTSANEDIPVLAYAERKLELSGYVNQCVFVQVKQRKKYEQEILEAKRQAELALTENRQLQELTRALEDQSLALDRHLRYQVIVNEDLLKFSKIVSHDLQEPVRKIQVFSDLIAHDPDLILTKKSTALLQKIDRAARRIRTLTNNLYQYISIDSSNTYAKIKLSKVINAARAGAVEFRQFDDFELVIEGGEVEIEGYLQQLELMFFHLIDNAIQYRDSSRRLEISIHAISLDENLYRTHKNKYKFAPHLRITFSDNGTGFNAEYKEYVFELLNKINPQSQGAGVGLSFVKKVVENHFGTVEVDTKEDYGTTFTIDLPMKVASPLI